MFEPAVRTDHATADAAPGRNSRRKESVTFGRAKLDHKSTGSRASYLTHADVKKQNKRNKYGSVRSSYRGSSASSRSGSTRRSTSVASSRNFKPKSRKSNLSSRSSNRSSQRFWKTQTRRNRPGRQYKGRRSYVDNRSVASSSHRGGRRGSSTSSNRYSSDWTTAQIVASRNRSPHRGHQAQSPIRRRAPSEHSSNRGSLRPRNKLKKPKRFRTGSSVTSSHGGRRKSSGHRGKPPIERPSRSRHRDPLICKNCNEPGLQ